MKFRQLRVQGGYRPGAGLGARSPQRSPLMFFRLSHMLMQGVKRVKYVWEGVLLLAAVLCALLLARRPGAAAASAAPGGQLIWIDVDAKRLMVYENGNAAASFPIAAGAADTPSPIGVFRVNRRFATALSGFGTRFLGLSVPWGQYGIHGTNRPSSIGQNASHGCIRLRVKDAEALYARVGTGTRVVIEGGPWGPLSWGMRTLREGDRGADVRQVQMRLKQRGLLWSADGVFGPATTRAVIRARQELGLPAGDQADAALQTRLGLMLFE